MRTIIFVVLVFLISGCKKENHSKVAFYMLSSFSSSVDLSTNPATSSITNAVVADTAFVEDKDIKNYNSSSKTFFLSKDITSVVKNYGPDKAFAVMVDNQIIYYVQFHPGYLSSMKIGVATYDPILSIPKQMNINFVTLTGNNFLEQLDKRNHPILLQAFAGSGRLK